MLLIIVHREMHTNEAMKETSPREQHKYSIYGHFLHQVTRSKVYTITCNHMNWLKQ